MNYPIDPRTSPAPVVSSRRAPSVGGVVVGGGLKIFKLSTDNHHRSIASPHTRSRAIRSSIASGVRPTRPQSSIERGVARARRVIDARGVDRSRARDPSRGRGRGAMTTLEARARERGDATSTSFDGDEMAPRDGGAREVDREPWVARVRERLRAVSYTHLTLPTIYSV